MTDPEALAAEGPSEAEEDEGDPLLLYARLAGDLPEIFKKDSASCFRSHPKFLLMGTVKGWLHVFDLEGNQVFKVCIHTGPVNDLSIEERGDYVATCSDDGTVVVTNICTQTHTKYAFAKPVQSVAFAVDFESMKKEKKSSFERWGMASGGLEGKLTITTKGLLSPHNNTIHQGEGAIHSIQWNGPFLAWANNQGVKVYDFARKRGLTYIARKSLDVDKVPVNEENYRACLAWGPRKDQDPYRSSSLVVGWGDSVTVAVGVNPKQSPRTRKSLSARAAHYQRGVASATSASYNNDFFFQVIANFRTDFLICGIGFFNEQLDLILLGTAPKKRKAGRRKNSEDEPDLLEVRVVSTDGRVELCSDALPASTINDSKQLTQPSNYRLAVPMLTDGDDPFYILCPKDILVLSPIRNANTVSSNQPLPTELPPADEKGAALTEGTEQEGAGVGRGDDEEEEDDDEEEDEEALRQLERDKQELEREEDFKEELDEQGNVVLEDQDGNTHLRDSQFQAAIETATGTPASPPKHLSTTTKTIPLPPSPPLTPVRAPEPVESLLSSPVVTAEELLQKARDFLLADRQERLGGVAEPTEGLDPEQFIEADAEEKMGIRRPLSPSSRRSLSDSLPPNDEQHAFSSPSGERRSLSRELDRKNSLISRDQAPLSSSLPTPSIPKQLDLAPRRQSFESQQQPPPTSLSSSDSLLSSDPSEPTGSIVLEQQTPQQPPSPTIAPEQSQGSKLAEEQPQQTDRPSLSLASPPSLPQEQQPEVAPTADTAPAETLSDPQTEASDAEARIHLPRGSYDFTTLPSPPEGLGDGALFARQSTLQDAHGGFDEEGTMDLGGLEHPLGEGALFNRQPTMQDPHGEPFPDTEFGGMPSNVGLSLSRQATLVDSEGHQIGQSEDEQTVDESKTNAAFLVGWLGQDGVSETSAIILNDGEERSSTELNIVSESTNPNPNAVAEGN